MRDTIAIKGAKENNLKNIDVEIPRDKLVVVTGLSGSGKSSLAFDTLYAEGQRRFMESLSAYSRRFVQQLKKPAVDSVYGLSPVVSIEQKTVNKNPRSTVGTLTDIYDFMRVLWATVGVAHCPFCEREVPVKSAYQMAEHLLTLPEGTTVEICAPVFKIYGEDYAYLFAEVRTQGCRRVRIDGAVHDLSEEIELDEGATYDMEAIVDRFVIRGDIQKEVIASIKHGLKVGEGYLRFRVLDAATYGSMGVREYGGAERPATANSHTPTLPHSHTPTAVSYGCSEHHVAAGELHAAHFAFNEPDAACRTCSGLGTYLQVHPDLLVPDKSRSIRGGAFVKEAFRYDKETYGGRIMHSAAKHYGFSLDTPWKELPPHVIEILFYGSKGEKFPLVLPEGAKSGDDHVGRLFRFDGIINQIERRYRHYRKQETAHSGMEEYLRKVMVEHVCPDCHGTKLKSQRLLVTVNGKNIHEAGELNISELREFLGTLPVAARQQQAGQQVVNEILMRLDLLLDIGLDYLNLNRKSMTLSGGESQRIRLSTQISSGLMGMLYVLDEPSIGLHPKDNVKMIATLRRLRDIGNSVIVVEHDEATIRAADHVLEIGPGPGVHGGEVVAQGTMDELLEHPRSLTGAFISGRRAIPVPAARREANCKALEIVGARHNNLKDVSVTIPLGLFVCITGASGSGKSTLVNEILYKKLYQMLHDSRVLPGEHEELRGIEYVGDVINIDQSPIGRTPRSNPATYIGFYDDIRQLFADQPEAKRRGYTASRFSFNVKGGRCEECGGEGTIVTKLHFMPDVETPCPTCKGARYNEETLEITYKEKNIAEVLEMSIEEGAEFFKGRPTIAHKIGIMEQLGLGYLKIGHPSTILSGGESQRIKLSRELSKIKRGWRNFYILDEPTTGLHMADIQRLLDCLNKLVEAGHTVLVIEHHLDVIKTADYVIDLGPEGGHNGGEVIAVGPPEAIAACPRSHTGRFLAEVLPAG